MMTTIFKRHFSLFFVLCGLFLASHTNLAVAQPAVTASQAEAVAPAPLPGMYDAKNPPAGAVWPWEGSDLKPDTTVTYGVLPNGMRYAIRPNQLPAKEVVLRFRIEAGSKYEREDQRGLAHFIEHMVFNGSTNFAEGELVKTMERLGSRFGSDINAYVSGDEAMFSLDLTSADGGRLETALKAFRETADRLLFEEAAVKREMGVVLSELNESENPFRKVGERTTQFLRPDDLSTKRSPIGLRPVIEGATGPKLREFYQTWYRPDRAVLVISGDVNAETTKALITGLFSDWKPKTPAMPPEPNNGTWPKAELRALVQVQPDMPSFLTVTAMRPDEYEYGELATEASRKWWVMHGIAADVFRRRLATLQLVDDPPASGISFSQSGNDNGWTAGFTIMPRDQDWERGLRAATVELRQAMDVGFNASEIAEAITESRVGYDRAIAGMATRRTGTLAGSVMGALSSKGVMITPQDSKRLFEEVAATATPEKIKEAFNWWWRGVDPALVLLSKTPLAGGEETLKAAWRNAMSAPLPARAAYVRANYTPLAMGAPGVLTSTNVRKDYDATIARFANGVTLAFKSTKFAADRVSISVNYGAGYFAFPMEDPYWTAFASATWNGDGVGNLTRDQMITALAGRSTSLASGGISNASTSLGAGVRKTDMAEQLQVMLSQVREPRLGPRAATLMRDQMKTVWDAIPLTAGGMFSVNASTFFYDGLTMFEEPSLARLLASDDAKGKEYLKTILANAPMNVTIVGDITWEEARTAVAATFGALPPRAGLSPGFEQLAPWTTRPTGGPPRVLRHKGSQTEALTHISWLTPGIRNKETSNDYYVLGQVLQLRLTAKVREAAGETYSPDGGWASETLVDKGRIYAQAAIKPEQVALVDGMIEEIARDLGQKGPTADEIQRVVGPALEGRARSRQSNGYWSGILSAYGLPLSPGSEVGDRLFIQAGAEARLRAVTPERVKALAARYMVPANAIRVQVLPTPPTASAPAPVPPPQPPPPSPPPPAPSTPTPIG
jgi:zinc protease